MSNRHFLDWISSRLKRLHNLHSRKFLSTGFVCSWKLRGRSLLPEGNLLLVRIHVSGRINGCYWQWPVNGGQLLYELCSRFVLPRRR